jgi:hypothetical protein
MMMTLQFIEIFAYIAFSSSHCSWSFLIATGLILFLCGLCGLVFGLLCSIMMKSVLSAYIMSQGTVYPVSFISGETKLWSCTNKIASIGFFAGTMWPVEGMPVGLRYIGEVFPFSRPTSTLRRLLAGDMNVLDSRVGLSCLILSIWILLEIFLSFKLIKK